jgi:hypothetical protein
MKKQDKGSGRQYEGGRSTKGWHKGEKVTGIAKLEVGTILIAVSHQFEAENLVAIIPTPNELPQCSIRYWRYVQPDGKPTGEPEAALWEWELTVASGEYFIAAKQLKGAFRTASSQHSLRD